MRIEYRPIGVIHSPFEDLDGMPIQPSAAEGVQGTVEVFAEFEEGLNDVDGFSHLILLYHFHRSAGFALLVTPFLDVRPRGVFATRAPRRPNPIGLSVVRLIRRDKLTLHVQNVDVLNGTPLLDIKPYVPEFDQYPASRVGWLSGKRGAGTRADKRFA